MTYVDWYTATNSFVRMTPVTTGSATATPITSVMSPPSAETNGTTEPLCTSRQA